MQAMLLRSGSALASRAGLIPGVRIMSVVSRIEEALDRQTDATYALLGGLCQIAAGMHTTTLGDQRNMAAVFFADASNHFRELEGRVSREDAERLRNFVDGICKGARK
jgi:hypothetical protein